VGLLLPDIHGEYFSELIRGVDRAARERGLHLLVSSSHGDTPEGTRTALGSMNGRVDGLLMMSPHVAAGSLAASLPPGFPTVLMNTRAARGVRPVYLVDDFRGARAMTSHLAACGYRRIAHIRGPRSNFDAEERLRGYRAGLGALRAAVIAGDFSEESGYRAGQALAAAGARPDAVFAGNDAMAIGCLFALTEAGLRVPDDVALAGFDDIPVARFVHPPLTTVRVDVAAMGRRALERLAAAIGDPKAGAGGVETVPVELVVRESCGANLSRRARRRPRRK
jgi:LacI family transcriptional regulator